MGYADRYYYGQGKLNIVTSSENNGKAVAVYNEDSTKYYASTIVDGKAEFTVAGTNLYTISLANEEVATVPMGYGSVKTIEV